MRQAEAAGVRVPHVIDVQPDAIVMERIEGRTTLEEIQAKPWRALHFAKELGRVHRSVLDAGLIHMDFHPLNVILSPTGPVVIDWSNGGGGEAEADVAFSQVILATSETDFPRWLEPIGRLVRRFFVRAYLKGVGIRPSAERLGAAAEQRALDPHLRPGELAAVKSFQPRTK